MGMQLPWRGRRRLEAALVGLWPRSPTFVGLLGAFARWLAAVRTHQFAATGDDPPHVAAASSSARDDAFEEFFLRYDRQITNYLWRMTGNEQIASELAQETFLRAWQHFATISHYEQPLAWLFHVATNLARQQHRRQTAPVGMATALDDAGELDGGDPTAHVAEQDLVRQTLLQLSFQQRAVLVLREVYGLSCPEIGKLLDMSHSAVKMALWRGREQFRIRYLREDEGD